MNNTYLVASSLEIQRTNIDHSKLQVFFTLPEIKRLRHFQKLQKTIPSAYML